MDNKKINYKGLSNIFLQNKSVNLSIKTQKSKCK